jgi:uncharacterized protein (TIGR03032 family)
LNNSNAPSNQQENKFHPSPGLAAWLGERNVSIAFSTYDSDKLFFLGSNDGENISLSFVQYRRAMGLCYHNETLFVASDNRVFELENIGPAGEAFDACFVPRRASFIGPIDCHEIAINDENEICFANTAYSTIAKLDKKHAFSVVAKPPFVSKIVPEDRCHLNGLAFNNGRDLVYSVVGKADTLEGWRIHRRNGGCVFDGTGRVIVSDLSMPHSPRYRGSSLYFLNSGRGTIAQPCGGDRDIFCPGFLRGLAFDGDWAIVTVSRPRQGIFKDLDLQDELEKRGGEAIAGILIVNLVTGAIDHWLKIDGPTRELFDCVLLPGIKCATAVAPADPNLLNRVTFATMGAT